MERKRLKYPIGRQDFASIREDGCVYVDKTDIIYNLVDNNKYVFLSRPRRFGKSLLLSTIRYYLEGRRDLFEGLRIMDLEKEWKKHPVFHLKLSRIDENEQSSLEQLLEEQFQVWEKEYEVTERYGTFSARFSYLIRSAFEKSGRRVVILVDEYDNPLINTIHDTDLHERYKGLLKSIYVNFKDMDEYIHFAMLTGVSRFSKMTVFSGLNNLNDISFNEKYSSICGFTEKEIPGYLFEGVKSLAIKRDISEGKAMDLLKQAYDGYHFSENLLDIYNPFSLLRSLEAGKLDNYWTDSGTPSFLIKKLKETDEPFSELFQEEADSTSLAAVDTAFTSPVALLYQTGYLTIKSYDKKENLYRLGVPNKEVREGFFSVVLQEFTLRDRMKGMRATRRMKECLEEGKPDEFLKRVESFFAGISYVMTSKAPEMYFENNLYIMLQMMGVDVISEDETSDGRIDLTIKTKGYIYIIEIKKDRNAIDALAQIENKRYALKYRHDGRKIFKIGINFSSRKRNITDWEIKQSD